MVLMLVHTRCHREGLLSGLRQFRPHVKFHARVSQLLGWAKGRGDLGPWVYRGYVFGAQGGLGLGVGESVRPEEPAKYISELPKLTQTDLSQSAVACGNWLAQVRQIMVGLSPSATVWWQGVEGPATLAYQRWLVADPLGRLSLDPSSVQGNFDRHLYGGGESCYELVVGSCSPVCAG